MRVAVVGTGISGLVAARGLAMAGHDLVVYERADRIGGHTATVDVEVEGRRTAVDTGFIVFNERTYPRFCTLLAELGVASQPSTMSFSVRCERTGLEYNGTSLDGLFAQRRNLLRPSFWRMVRDILRFYREAVELLPRPGAEDDGGGPTLGRYLSERGYSREFVDQHILPMAAAVWSTDLASMLDFPARFLVQFFHNHGFLQVGDRPVWRVLRGGSRSYLGPLTAPFQGRIRTGADVVRVSRDAEGPLVETAAGDRDRFDHVVMACHSDQALRLLADPSAAEREVLGAIRYQPNDVCLHTDASLLPVARRAWASWNYHLLEREGGGAAVTYLMNHLQGFLGPPWLCVTLNRSDAIDPAKVLRRFVYDHPVFTPAAVRAQRRWAEVCTDRTSYCGAYWRYGFHEDGVASAERVVERLRRTEPACLSA